MLTSAKRNSGGCIVDKKIYYHFCQHPETLTLQTLEPRGIYLSPNSSNWSSPHLKDVIGYAVILKPGVRLKKIYSRCDYEYLDRKSLVAKYKREGYNGIEHRAGEKDHPDFVDYEWMECSKKGPSGDSGSDQIYLFNAVESIQDVYLDQTSGFQDAADFMDVNLPRNRLSFKDDVSVATIRESLELAQLVHKHEPNTPYHWCLFDFSNKRFTIRYIPKREVKTFSLKNENDVAAFIEELIKTMTTKRI